MYRFLSESDAWATVNALRIAAERYAEHAKTAGMVRGCEGLAHQFTRQYEEARRIADAIEEGL